MTWDVKILPQAFRQDQFDTDAINNSLFQSHHKEKQIGILLA
jgi:hypothetical protein